MRNNKGSIGSGLTWIPAMFIIGLILVSHVIFTILIFGETVIGGRHSRIDMGYSIDINHNRNFLNFLNSEIVVDGKKERVVDAIRFSLDPYFEIKNKEGMNFFYFFDTTDLNVEFGGLKSAEITYGLPNKMGKVGFSTAQSNKVMRISSGFENTERFKKITEQLDIYYRLKEKYGKYTLEIPQGILHNERDYRYRSEDIEYFEETSSIGYTPYERSYIYGTRVNFRTTYRGEAFNIKFFIIGQYL
jgi:hypothetical protein